MPDMQIPDDPVDRIAPLTEAFAAIRTWTPPPGVMPDISRRVRIIEKELGGWRRASERAAAEAVAEQAQPERDRIEPTPYDKAPAVAGRDYDLEPNYSVKREFNVPAILLGVAGDGGSFMDTYNRLVAEGVLQTTVAWSKFKTFAKANGVRITRARFGEWYEDSPVEPGGLAEMRAQINNDAGTDAPMVGEFRKLDGYTPKAVK